MPVSSVGSTVSLSDGFVSHSAEVHQSLVLIRQYNTLLLCATTPVWRAGISQYYSQSGLVNDLFHTQQKFNSLCFTFDSTMLNFRVPLQQYEVPVSVTPPVRLNDGIVSQSAEVQQSLIVIRQYNVLLPYNTQLLVPLQQC